MVARVAVVEACNIQPTPVLACHAAGRPACSFYLTPLQKCGKQEEVLVLRHYAGMAIILPGVYITNR